MDQQITFKLDEEADKKIREAAAKNYESLSGFIRRAAIAKSDKILNGGSAN